MLKTRPLCTDCRRYGQKYKNNGIKIVGLGADSSLCMILKYALVFSVAVSPRMYVSQLSFVNEESNGNDNSSNNMINIL